MALFLLQKISKKMWYLIKQMGENFIKYGFVYCVVNGIVSILYVNKQE